MKGIDIHPSYQQSIQLDGSKLDFAIVKATEALSQMTAGEGWRTMAQRVVDAGMLLGLYHFVGQHDPISEADIFINAVEPYLGRAVLALDWEGTGASGSERLWSFMNHVHTKTGIWPILYCDHSNLIRITVPEIAANCGLWYAWWPHSAPVGDWERSNIVRRPGGWTLVAWQCGVMALNAAATVFGSRPMNVDLDWFYGDEVTWGEYAHPQAGALSAQNPSHMGQPYGIEDLALRVIAGEFGNGDTRRLALGSLYQQIQTCVNTLLKQQQSYTIQMGDTLSAIARRFNTTVIRLAIVNHITNPDRIYAGRTIRVI